MSPKGVMVHSPGVAQDDVNVFLKAWDPTGAGAVFTPSSPGRGAVRTLPWNWRGWHAGVPAGGGVSASNTHISFEMLEPDGHAYQGAVMVGYDVEEERRVFRRRLPQRGGTDCHAVRSLPSGPHCPRRGHQPRGGHVLGVASNHADVGQWFP